MWSKITILVFHSPFQSFFPCSHLCYLYFVLFVSRYERRMIEQDNKRERKERKKEEMARIRQLVGMWQTMSAQGWESEYFFQQAR